MELTPQSVGQAIASAFDSLEAGSGDRRLYECAHGATVRVVGGVESKGRVTLNVSRTEKDGSLTAWMIVLRWTSPFWEGIRQMAGVPIFRAFFYGDDPSTGDLGRLLKLDEAFDFALAPALTEGCTWGDEDQEAVIGRIVATLERQSRRRLPVKRGFETGGAKLPGGSR